MAHSFVYCLNLEEYNKFLAGGSSELEVEKKEGNRINQIGADSLISLYVTDKNGFSAHLKATGPAVDSGDKVKIPVTNVISVPEKDFVGWKVMQDNLDWMREFPAKTWNPTIGGELRKLHYFKDNTVIFRSMEMALESPKAEKKPKPVPAAKPETPPQK